MSFHGGFTGCVLAVVLFARKRGIPILSLGDLTCAVGPIGLFLGRIANFVNGELWGRPTDVPWAMVFPAAGRCRAIRASFTRRRWKAWCCCSCSLMIRAGALKRPGLIIGVFALRLCAGARDLRILPRAGCATRLPVGRRDHGQCCCRSRCSSPASASSPMRMKHEPLRSADSMRGPDTTPLESRDPPPHRGGRADAGRRIHGALPVRPAHGYYTTRDPLGARGDFITAPEISQMFGELIGLWMAAVWKQHGLAGECARHRARPRPRHHDEGRAARGQGDAGIQRADRAAPGRDQPGAAGAAAARAGARPRRRSPGTRRSTTCRRARHRRRQRILRRAAGQPSGEEPKRLARALRRHRRRRQVSPSRSAREPIAAIRPRCCRRRCATRRPARCSNGATTRAAMELGRRIAATAAPRW